MVMNVVSLIFVLQGCFSLYITSHNEHIIHLRTVFCKTLQHIINGTVTVKQVRSHPDSIFVKAASSFVIPSSHSKQTRKNNICLMSFHDLLKLFANTYTFITMYDLLKQPQKYIYTKYINIFHKTFILCFQCPYNML